MGKYLFLQLLYGALGAITTYNRDTQNLTIKYGQYWYLFDMPNHKDSYNNTINEFTIGKNEYDTIKYESEGTAYHYIKWLAIAPSIIDNNIMLSAKDFVGLLDYEVNWDATTKTLSLSKKWSYISITPWYSELNYLLEYNPNIQNMVTGKTYPSTYIPTPLSTTFTGNAQNSSPITTPNIYYDIQNWVPDFSKITGAKLVYQELLYEDNLSGFYVYDIMSGQSGDIEKYIGSLKDAGFYYDVNANKFFKDHFEGIVYVKNDYWVGMSIENSYLVVMILHMPEFN